MGDVMKKVRYKKPNDSVIEVNDTEANREYALINGWSEIKPEVKRKEVKPRERVDSGDLLDSLQK